MRRRMRPTGCPSREPMPESISSSTRIWLLLPAAAASAAAAAASCPAAAVLLPAAAPPAASLSSSAAAAAAAVPPMKAGAALRASMMRADSPPEATADSGRSGSPCPAANKKSTVSSPLVRTRYRPAASPHPAAAASSNARLPPLRSPPLLLLPLRPLLLAAEDSGVQLMRTSNWLPPIARSDSTDSTAARRRPAASRRCWLQDERGSAPSMLWFEESGR